MNHLEALAIPALTSFFGVVFAIKWLHPLTLKVGLVDTPADHKEHSGIIPLIGGIGMYIAITLAALLFLPINQELGYILIAGGLLTITGAVDDKIDISFKIRLVIQALSGLLLYYGANIKLLSLGSYPFIGEIALGLTSPLFTVLAVMVAINAYNMIDGLDGLAGSLALVTFISIALLIWPDVSQDTRITLVLFISALLAYLLFNLNIFPGRLPKVFMGDAGSMFIGFCVAAYLIRYSQESRSLIEPHIVLWLITIPVFDMFATFIRRIKNKKSPFFPDRTHIHHIFQRAGLGNKQTLLIILIISTGLALFGIISQLYNINPLISILLLATYFATHFYLIKHSWKLSKLLKK